MENPGSESSESNKINIVNVPPSPDYQPTVHLALLQVVASGKGLVSTTVIQKYYSVLVGHEPVWVPLPSVVMMQKPQLIVVPGRG